MKEVERRIFFFLKKKNPANHISNRRKKEVEMKKKKKNPANRIPGRRRRREKESK